MTTPVANQTFQTSQSRFYGKYRGLVTGNVDPEARARIEVLVPEVRGEGVTDWALPALPYAGDRVGFFVLPPVGANVWVEYEAGNLQFPIWSGCFWERGQIDTADAVPEVMFLKTDQATLRIDNAAGEILIEIGGAKILMTSSEIRIEAPQIKNTAGSASTQLSAGGFDALQGALKVI